MNDHRHPLSPVLDHCPPTLPAHAYYDAAWFAQEMATIWARNWVWAGRLADLKPDWQEMLRGVYAEHLEGLRELARGDDQRMAS